MKTLNESLREIIKRDEIGNADPLAFDDPDGVRSGKSGWSFGAVQWDTRNNTTALACLRDCGFTQDEIHGIVDQTIDVRPLAAKLKAHADVVERYDEAQLQYCLDGAGRFLENYGLPCDGNGGLLALADYINQYGMPGLGSASYYRSQGQPITAEMVLDFKLKITKYGKDHPADCLRRYNNLIDVLKTENA
ncbi:hypothetical protein F6V30_13915 [Oryzomonas sagensis]|uniref:Uncharacterized protein n=1 Tax=Oryzomonas sagensis TaxID=2603857 RepID=A0ABQ6TKZ2_9BACT|nr:hypothetical protein [Oryzomonas sagensis]KAB0668929.1 hypothetical protein F6V30_13915 [Oryzomonas sagensis]